MPVMLAPTMSTSQKILEGFAFRTNQETHTFRVKLDDDDTVAQVIIGIQQDLLCHDVAVWKVWHPG
jgi:hypothetical protein